MYRRRGDNFKATISVTQHNVSQPTEPNDYPVLLQVECLLHHSFPTAAERGGDLPSTSAPASSTAPCTGRYYQDAFQEDGNNLSAPTLHFTLIFSSPLNYKGRLCALHVTKDKSEYQE